MGENWKEFIRQKLCDLAGVSTVREINVNMKLAVIEKLRALKGNRLELVPSYLYMVANKKIARLEVKYSNNKYQLCDNYGN